MDAVAAMRKAQAEKYRRTEESEKPHDRKCGDCSLSVYSAQVCPATGIRHDLDRVKVIGGVAVDADHKVFTGKELVSAIDGVRVKWQPARTAKVLIDHTAANIFQTFILQREWKLQRMGILYGTYDAAAQVVSVHCIYEGEQHGDEHTVTATEDAREARVDKLAELLGLRRVGVIMSHPPRDMTEMVLSGRELLYLAREQSRFGDECVLITIAPNPDTMQIDAQAWQGTRQCVNLFQLGFLAEHEDDIRYISSTQPLEIAQEDVDARGKKSCVIRAPATAVDTQWMTAYCAVESFASPVVGNLFVRTGRPGAEPVAFTHLRTYMSDAKRKHLPFVERIADFHVLIFLMEHVFSLRDDVPALARAVVAKDARAAEGFEHILAEHMRAVGAN
jgi:nuclear protein localization family protein 4